MLEYKGKYADCIVMIRVVAKQLGCSHVAVTHRLHKIWAAL